MAQTNSNATYVLNNNTRGVVAGDTTPTNLVLTSTNSKTTILNSANSTGVDKNTQNGDYATAKNFTNVAADGLVKNIANVFVGNIDNVSFLPTEGALRVGTTGEFNPNATTTAGNYFNPASWTLVPKVSPDNASAFTLTDTNDGGKTLTLTETISGSPFTTGNGAVSEALVFRGTASDTLAIKHNVAVANVPAATNNNGGSALDVRNETYAETYAKSGVTSNYAKTTVHKYAEVNGNQSLNDARAETYVYKDAGLAITSTVKTTVADAAYINGVERIVESNVANYSYEGVSGSVKYIVTDTRNLAQSDQRTYTNITTTNVAQFKVVDKTVAANTLTVEASGIITGTTTNLSTPVTIAEITQQTTTFAPTNAKFTVSNTNYSLAVDAGQFKVNALNQNIFDNVLGLGNGGTLTGLGNGGTLFAPIDDLTSQPVRPITLASAKYLPAATFIGTDFADAIKVNEIAGAVAGTFFGGNVNGGAGNDTITGSKGNDTIEGGTGADTFIVNAGNDKIEDFLLGTDTLTATKGTSTTEVMVKFATLADGTTPADVKYIVTANATTDVTIPAFNADKTAFTKADLDKLAAEPTSGVKMANPFDFSDSTTGISAVTGNTDGDDLMLGSAFADKLSGGKGNDTIKGGAGDDSLLNGNDGNDSVEGNDGNDVLRGNAGNDTLIGGAGNDTLNGGTGIDVLTGGTGNDTFAFTSATAAGDSTTITDFVTTVDKIDLSGVDANSAITADQAFSSTILAGTAPFTAAGQLRFSATTNTLEGNTDANFTTTEFSVVLTGVTTVVATDFVL
jgi:hypothetical protein